MHIYIIFSTDPMSRYLKTAQEVPICGLYDREWIESAVTMGRTLYVTTSDFTEDYARVFMYDLDDSDVRREDPQRKKITCSNRRPLVVNGLVGRVGLLVPCPHTNTLYVLEEHPHVHANALVHRVKQDGTVLSRWALDLPRYAINSMALNPSGSYLVVTCDDQVNVYETVHGHLVDTEEVTDENILHNEIFVASAFQDDSIDSVVTVTSQETYYKGEMLVLDGHQCLLMMTSSNFRLFNKTTSKHRYIAIDKSLVNKFPSTHHWYDKDRGLVFCSRNLSLRVFRVTL